MACEKGSPFLPTYRWDLFMMIYWIMKEVNLID